MQLMNEKKIDMKPLITHALKMNEIEKAFNLAKDKPAGFIKSVLVMD
jgi:threonine dehydrogenase-like Zn-dependent dehydrogenase